MFLLRLGASILLFLQLGKGVKSRISDEADYFFMVDASATISATDFKKQLDFVHTIIDDLGIDQKLSRSCLLTYGERASVQFGLESFQSQSGIINAVSKATQVEGSGGTEYALRLMLSLFEKHKKPRIPVFAILFIGEKPANIVATMQQAQIARRSGIIVFGVAIGNEVDDETLKSIASQPEFILRDITDIDRIHTVLKKKTCELLKDNNSTPERGR